MQMVLGLSWDVVSEELSCKLSSNLDCTQERPVTKRVLLSVINNVYDPIGFTAPSLLLPKLLMQEAWRDDPKELKPLTPAHFIQDIKERETFDLDLIDSQHILKRVRYLHTLRSNLRKRFYTEYLGELDGVERVAKLRLASGETIRALQRIYPLELSASDHLSENPQGTDIAAQTPGPTAADVLEEGKKSQCGRPLIPVKRLNL
ncbi:integrase catalytic domain-containing protein [Trichonephila clavipes]|nr:integrase catalytic domain-containing protein [Trichonephila clavipes]